MAEPIASLNLLIRASAANLSADINRGINSAKGSVGVSAVALGNIISTGILSGLGKLAGTMQDVIGKAVNMAASFETTKVQFKTLLGDMGQAEKMLATFRQLDQNSPLQFADFADAGKTLLAFGADAQSLVPTMKMLGDVSLGNGERFKSLALAFGQVQASGRLMGQEVLQFVNAGFNPLQQISQRTGESMGALKKRMEDANVSFAEVKQAFQDATGVGGRFFGAMEAGGKTFEGAMAKVRGSIDQVYVTLGSKLNEAVLPALQKLPAIIDQLKPKIEEAARLFGLWSGELIKSQGGIDGIGKSVGGMVLNIAEGTAGFVNFGEQVSVAFSFAKLGAQTSMELLKEMQRLGVAAATTIKAAFSVFWDWMKLKLQETANGIVEMADKIEKTVTKVATGAKNIANKTFNPLAKESFWDFQSSEDADLPSGGGGANEPSLLLPFDTAAQEAALAKSKEELKNIQDAAGKILADARVAAGNRVGASANAANAGLSDLLKQSEGMGDRWLEGWKKRAEEAKIAIPPLLKRPEDLITLPPMAEYGKKENYITPKPFRMQGVVDYTGANNKIDDSNDKKETDNLKKEAAARSKLRQAEGAATAGYRAVDLQNLAATEAQKQGITTASNQAMVEAARAAAEQTASVNKATFERFRQIGQESITSMVTAWATGTGKISDIVSRWANQMIEQFIQVSLWGNKAGGGSISGLLGQFSGGAAAGSSGGSSTSGWMSAIGSILGGFFADGGRPPMGKVSVVGERGPELFVPDSAGKIIPNNRMGAAMSAAGGGGGGGGMEMASPIIINQTFQNGITRAELAGSMDEMMDQTKTAVASAISRGGGYRKRVQS